MNLRLAALQRSRTTRGILLSLRCALATTLLAGAASAGDPLSTKRGFGDVGANYNILQASNAGWYYGWRPDKPSGVGNFNADFVPMIWGPWQANQTEINNILSYGDVEWVLGFNEPERPDQANTSVTDAVAAWRTLSTGFTGTNVKLVSPGVADTGGAAGGQAWLADFMNRVNSEGLKIDAVAFHWYGVSNPNDPIAAANSFISRVDSYHNSYGLPVWITEFGIIDWGGAYTDAQMRAANAIFLDNVIPRLESRSYVAGYAFYNWTGDTTLVEGNPLKPTNVGVEYVGAIEPGQVYNLSGIDLGEHVAYLTGGELTHTGAATGRVQYLNALSGASRISGAVEWGLGEGNWARIQPGATLRKTGANRIVFDRSAVTNNGVIEVASGELVLRSGPTVTGSGSISVGANGTLVFDGSVRGGPGRVAFPLTLDGGRVEVDATTGMTLLPGGSLSGDGVIANKLTANAGTVVRVGAAGIAVPAWSKIDDFESYTPGKLNAGATSGVWTGVFNGTANAQVVSASGNESIEFYGTGSAWRGAGTNLDSSFGSADYSLADGDTATYFFQVQRQGAATIDGVFGLTDLESIGTDSPWADLGVTLSLFRGTGGTDTTALRAYDGDGGGDITLINNIAANQWINVWLVVDNQAKTFEVATSLGSANGVLFPRTFEFGRRSGAGEALDTFAGAEFRSPSNTASASVRLDNFYLLEGENLANPLSGSPGVFVDPGHLRVEGDFELLPTARIELDLFDPAAFDSIESTGVLKADGVLQLSLAPEAPALEAGDAFDLLDFASSMGSFDQIVLPGLGAGLSWDLSQLYTTGQLAVVAGVAGDFNNDGVVNAADYTTWRDNVGQPAGSLPNDPTGVTIGAAQHAVWANAYGNGTASSVVIPEPASLVLVAFTACGACNSRRATWGFPPRANR